MAAFINFNNISGNIEYEVIKRRMEPSDAKGYERISAIKCRITILGQESIFSTQEVIQKMKEGHKFFTAKNKKAYIESVKDAYIRTIPDQEESNNLLSLPVF